MIATEFYDGQGLGNQLWAYAACRSIAEKLQLPHKIMHPEGFKGASFLDIDSGVQGASRIDSVFHERLFYDRELDCFSSGFDKAVLDLKPFTQIHGYFQSEDYFFGDLARLKTYIRVKAAPLQKALLSDGCCVLNIRGGEYKGHKNLLLPKSYWQNAMRHMRGSVGIDKFLVVTDDPRYAHALFPELPALPGGIAECYVALYQAKHLILSNSSFAYFPVKTGLDKTLVIAPMHWARFGNPYSRWTSAANLYRSWMWQDVHGKLRSYEDCLPEQSRTQAYYDENYYVLTQPEALMKRQLREYIPKPLRRTIKKGLSWIFPKHFA